MSTPIILEGDISYELRVDSLTLELITFELTILSDKFSTSDLLFEYQINGVWYSDAVISAPKFKENMLLSVNCNEPYRFGWYHPKNGLSRGSACNVRITQLPQAAVLAGDLVRQEVISENSHSLSSGYSIRKVVNLGFNEKRLCVSGNQLIVCGPVNNIMNSFTAGSTVVWAQEKRDGNFIVLTDGGHLMEFSPASISAIRDIDLSSNLMNPKYFLFDELTLNILVAGYNNHYVYEIAWGHGSFGNILQTTSILLSKPISATYFPDRSKIAIIDLSSSPTIKTMSWMNGLISSTSTLPVDSVNVQLNNPFIPFVTEGNDIVIIEQLGKTKRYSQDPTTHSALVRSGAFVGTGEDTLRAYQGLTFAPLIHTQI